MRGHHVLEIGCAGRATDDRGTEEAVGRPGEFLADVVAQQFEITHLSGDTVTVAPGCAGRVRYYERRWSSVGGREGSLLLESRGQGLGRVAFVPTACVLVVVVVVINTTLLFAVVLVGVRGALEKERVAADATHGRSLLPTSVAGGRQHRLLLAQR